MSVVLDWSRGGWADEAEPCPMCDVPTHMRSPNDKAAHKVCAERWTEQHAARVQAELAEATLDYADADAM